MRIRLYLVSGLTVLFLAGGAEAQVYTGWSVGESADGSGTILYSVDSGNSWTRQGVGQLANADLGGIKAVDHQTAWVVGKPDSTGYATVYQTTDAGANWTRHGGGQAALANAELRKVQTAGSDKIWAVGSYIDGGETTHGVIAHSGDGGVTWVNQYPSAIPGNELQGLYTTDGQHVWATGTPQTYDPTGESFALALYSEDSGQSWTRLVGGDITNWTHINGISAADTSNVWAIPGFQINGGAGNGIIYSDDGGANWALQTDEFGGFFDGNEIDVVDDQIVWAVNDTYVMRTTDGGANWEAFGQNLNFIMGICGVSEMEAWASVNGKMMTDEGYKSFGSILHTADGGQSWSTYGGIDSNVAPLWTVDMVAIPEPGVAALFLMAIPICSLARRRFVD